MTAKLTEHDTPMPAQPTARPVAVGESFHSLMTGVTFSTGAGWLGASHVTTRGETFVLTSAIVEATTNRLGDTWTDRIHDEQWQRERWGKPRFAPGPAPEGMQPWERGTSDWEAARRSAVHDASREPDSARRAAALRRVQEVYGDAPATSWSTDAPEGGRAAERAHNADMERRKAHGIKYAAISSSEGER